MIVLFLHIISYDIWFYISHRILHTQPFWWIHKEHHKYIEPTWPDTYKGHWLESAIQSGGYLFPFFIGHWNPTETFAALVLINLRGIARHDARTSWIDGGHHLVHHKVFNKNYGEHWLDWIFNTLSKKS